LYDALYGERVARHVARDLNQESSDSQSDTLLLEEQGQVNPAFATMPPPFSDRNHCATTRTSRFHTDKDQTPGVLTRVNYWINNRPTLLSTTWATVTAHLPIIPPPTETREIKNTVFNSFTQCLQDADEEWTDKSSLFLLSFEQLVPATSLEADVVITNFNNYGSAVFNFESYECYDNMYYEPVAIGGGANFTNPELSTIKWFKFALNVAPQQANPGHIAVRADQFPSRSTNTVLAPKHLLC
jgi:hypothetical protein